MPSLHEVTATHARTSAAGTVDVRAFTGGLPPSVGERNPSARMTEDKVRAIRAAYDAGARISGLADAFDIDTRTARHIAKRTSWTHVL